MVKLSEKWNKWSRVGMWILWACLLPVTAYLAYQGVRTSYLSSTDYGQPIFAVKDSLFKNLAFFAAVVLCTVILCRIPDRFKAHLEKICAVILFAAFVWMAVTGFGYVAGHPYYPTGDQINTTAGAVYAREGNFSMFTKGGYIGLYEQQKGLLFLYEIFFGIFGDFRYDLAAVFHVGLNLITLMAGYGFLKIVGKKPLYRILYCGLMMFCAPYFLYLPYIYGDIPSICFTTVLFWALASYARAFQKRYIVLGAFAGALALLVRMNSLIVLIGVLIGMVVLAMQKRRLQPILAGLCIVLAAWGSVKAVDIMYEYRSGYESGVGIPKVLWMAMGLQDSGANPGVYNRYQQTVFEECGFDQEAASAIGKVYIKERLLEMAEDPAYTLDFFDRKVKSQWLEPLFESLYATETFGEDKPVPDWVNSLYYGQLHDVVWKFSNRYQSVLYLAVFAFCVAGPGIRGRRQKAAAAENAAPEAAAPEIVTPEAAAPEAAAPELMTPEAAAPEAASPEAVAWIPMIAVLGGFLFSIIWENQCRYVMPYYVYLVMYGAWGLGITAETVNKMIKRIKK